MIDWIKYYKKYPFLLAIRNFFTLGYKLDVNMRSITNSSSRTKLNPDSGKYEVFYDRTGSFVSPDIIIGRTKINPNDGDKINTFGK